MLEIIKLSKQETEVLLEYNEVVHKREEGDFVHIILNNKAKWI